MKLMGDSTVHMGRIPWSSMMNGTKKRNKYRRVPLAPGICPSPPLTLRTSLSLSLFLFSL